MSLVTTRLKYKNHVTWYVKIQLCVNQLFSSNAEKYTTSHNFTEWHSQKHYDILTQNDTKTHTYTFTHTYTEWYKHTLTNSIYFLFTIFVGYLQKSHRLDYKSKSLVLLS